MREKRDSKITIRVPSSIAERVARQAERRRLSSGEVVRLGLDAVLPALEDAPVERIVAANCGQLSLLKAS